MKFLISGIICLHCLAAFGQQQQINGTVVDKFSHIPLPGVSVSFGNNGTTTNNNGFFSLTINSNDRLKVKLEASCVGYFTRAVSISAQDRYTIEMEINGTALGEIIVGSGAEKIIQKAIAHIPQNYPVNNFSLTGIKRFYRTETDSPKVYRYFKSDAVVIVNYPSYADTATDAETIVLQNKIIYTRPNEPHYDTSKWTGGYLTDDFVHKRADFINPAEMGNYSYYLVGKTNMQGCRVWIINFRSKNKLHADGALFIDTASYAFVAAKYSKYNIRRLGYRTIERSVYDVIFENNNGRWFLYKKSQETLFRFSKAVCKAVADFLSIAIQDVHNTGKTNQGKRVKLHEEDITISKPESDSNWLHYDSIFSKAEYENILTVIPVPIKFEASAAAPGNDADENPFYQRRNYLENTRIRLSLSAEYINLRSSSAAKGALGIGFGSGIKIFERLYFHLFNTINFKDANKTTSSKLNVSLLYSLNVSTKVTPFYVTPKIGFTIAELTTTTKKLKKLLQWNGGFCISFPVKPKLRPYLVAEYNYTFKNKGVLYDYFYTPFSFSAGSFFIF